MQADELAIFSVKPNIPSIPEGRIFYSNLIGKLRVLPGVESVRSAKNASVGWWSDNSNMLVDGRLPEVANGGSRTVRSNVAGADFFKTLGVPVLAGRDFADSDTATSPPVGIINEEFARRFCPMRIRSATRLEPTMGAGP